MSYTYSKIATYTVDSGGIPSVSFLNIPQTYTDLVIKTSIKTTSTGAGNGVFISLNGSSTSFSRRILYGDGSTAASASASDGGIGVINGTTETASTFSSTDIYITNYTSSNYKSLSSDSVMENNATASYAILYASLWSNTSAVTSITLTPGVGSFAQYTTFHLYGIKAEL